MSESDWKVLLLFFVAHSILVMLFLNRAFSVEQKQTPKV
jgi:hypothetical protein